MMSGSPMKRPAAKVVLKKPASIPKSPQDSIYKTDRCKKRKFEQLQKEGKLPKSVLDAYSAVPNCICMFSGWSALPCFCQFEHALQAKALKGRERQQMLQQVVNNSFTREGEGKKNQSSSWRVAASPSSRSKAQSLRAEGVVEFMSQSQFCKAQKREHQVYELLCVPQYIHEKESTLHRDFSDNLHSGWNGLYGLYSGAGQPKPSQVEQPDIHRCWLVKGHCHDRVKGGIGGAAIQDGDCQIVTDDKGRQRYLFLEEQVGEEMATSATNDAIRHGQYSEEDFNKAKELALQTPGVRIVDAEEVAPEKLGEIHGELQKVLVGASKMSAECAAFMKDCLSCMMVTLSGRLMLAADWAFSLKTHKKRSTSKKLCQADLEAGIEESARIVSNLFDTSKALRFVEAIAERLWEEKMKGRLPCKATSLGVQSCLITGHVAIKLLAAVWRRMHVLLQAKDAPKLGDSLERALTHCVFTAGFVALLDIKHTERKRKNHQGKCLREESQNKTYTSMNTPQIEIELLLDAKIVHSVVLEGIWSCRHCLWQHEIVVMGQTLATSLTLLWTPSRAIIEQEVD
eukprot:2071358-Amphidinium_carterae.1